MAETGREEVESVVQAMADAHVAPTQRELEVLRLVAKGNSTKDIAARLFISENTVENHRKSLFRKLRARNMAELTVKAIVQGFVTLEELV